MAGWFRGRCQWVLDLVRETNEWLISHCSSSLPPFCTATRQIKIDIGLEARNHWIGLTDHLALNWFAKPRSDDSGLLLLQRGLTPPVNRLIIKSASLFRNRMDIYEQIVQLRREGRRG